MIGLVVLLAVAILVIGGLAFLLGFRLGGNAEGGWLQELQRVRAEAADAERQMHDLTRSAFIAMAEEAARRRPTEG